MAPDVTSIRGPIAPLDAAALADQDAIRQLCRTYALAIDTRDEAMLRSLFWPKAKMKGTLAAGLAEDYLPRLLDGVRRFSATMHTILNQYVVLSGDEGRVWSYAVAYHVPEPPDASDHLVMGVQYRDEVQRTAGCWWIVGREVVRIWETGRGAPER